ncbi:MAG: T9SS type A sorting domain-containing protein [Ignavibacteriae bacterium]|nr:T9SS type A sorting domain-containing protein [Ignavibacteriota bacterium]
MEWHYPHPLNGTTQIVFRIADAGYASLKVYDVLGREVADLYEGRWQPGVYAAACNASDLASDVYLCRLSVDGFSETRRLILMKYVSRDRCATPDPAHDGPGPVFSVSLPPGDGDLSVHAEGRVHGVEACVIHTPLLRSRDAELSRTRIEAAHIQAIQAPIIDLGVADVPGCIACPPQHGVPRTRDIADREFVRTGQCGARDGGRGEDGSLRHCDARGADDACILVRDHV